MNTVSEKIKEIITNMAIDNGLIVNEAKSIKVLTLDEEFMGYLNTILDYDSYLFNVVIYYELPKSRLGEEVNNEFVQMILISILAECIRFRNKYDRYSYGYKFLNSLYDRIAEAFNDVNNSI